jgi:serine/threonine protein kinase
LSKEERASLDKAIEYMHVLNVVHNDLKCDNVLFCDDGKVFVIDYGFSELKPKECKVSVKDEGNYTLI